MFCPSCGGEYTIELKYCNRCGANLSTAIAPPVPIAPASVTKPTLIISLAMVLVTILGFGLLLTGAVELSHGSRIDPNGITTILVFGMLAILTIDIFLVRLLSKLINAALSPSTAKPQFNPQAARHTPPQLPQANTSRFQQASSVTENTTRFFDPVYRPPVEAEDNAPLKNEEK